MPRKTWLWTLGFVLTASMLAGCIQTSPESGADSVLVQMKNLEYAPGTITVGVGTTVTWINKDPFAHTITPTDKAAWGTSGSGDDPAQWLGEGISWSFTFTKPGTYQYYCIPHAAQDKETGAWTGMVATVIVKAGASNTNPSTDAAGPGPAKALEVQEIGRSAFDVPAPIGQRGPPEATFNLTSLEVIGEMADGTTYRYWTFDGTVPGPMLRVREGDVVTINHHNDASSIMTHNIDFHAVNGPGGGAAGTIAAPGETATITFRALNAGLYVYHCAYQDPPLHIAHGMYGLILVEPEGGLAPVDKEYYVFQSEFYSPHKASEPGHHEYDGDRAASEDPTFVVFNGRMDSLTGERALQAEVGDTVRLFVGNGGPNLVGSFHVIGEIFDRSYDQASLETEPQRNVQTTLVPAGGAAMVEFLVEYPGDYYLVDHSIFRVHKGAFGVLTVTGEADSDVYREGA